jgi:hypothetical protein
MGEPRRYQRKRNVSADIPPDAVYVGRPTRWGNPFPVAKKNDELFARADAVRMYRELLEIREAWFDGHRFTAQSMGFGPTIEDVRRELRGKSLVCWCPLDVSCHGDHLLEVAANG